MKKYKFLILLFCVPAIQYVSAQEVLPGITVKNFNGKIIVSWQNAYNIPVTNISIQRSFDSTKNFSTIGTVLNPQNLENGFADDKPPYNKMYYRVFISFEGGSYLFSSTARPVKDPPIVKRETSIANVDITASVPEDSTANNTDTAGKKITAFPWHVSALTDSIAKLHAKKDSLGIKNDPEVITYPSQRIFTGKDNNLVIHLRDAPFKKYSVKFFDENDNFIFELTKLREEFLIVEKVNFVHSGWFHFQLFENGKLIEKNKFFIGKDGKNMNSESYKKGNK
ncbi:MAG: hypothetical protein ABI741_03800 [Ferruginibacter sp.]